MLLSLPIVVEGGVRRPETTIGISTSACPLPIVHGQCLWPIEPATHFHKSRLCPVPVPFDGSCSVHVDEQHLAFMNIIRHSLRSVVVSLVVNSPSHIVS